VFIPLTFIVGVYGMNFEHMPELAWRYGYLMIWVVMLAVAVAMYWYFRRRGIFDSARGRPRPARPGRTVEPATRQAAPRAGETPGDGASPRVK
jgi:hypothetical protein